MKNNLKIPNEPSWMREVQQSSMLNPRDVVQIFGYANPSSLYIAVDHGNFPKPDKRGVTGFTSRMWWTVLTVRNEIRRRLRLQRGVT